MRGYLSKVGCRPNACAEVPKHLQRVENVGAHQKASEHQGNRRSTRANVGAPGKAVAVWERRRSSGKYVGGVRA